MGLIYSSSDSSSLINGLKANLNSGKEVTEQLKSGSQKVISAVNGKTLSGAAYTAGKGLFSELILPTISKVTTAIDNVEQELQQYTAANGKIAGEGNLDEDKLNQQITIKKSMKASVEASAAVARALSRMNPVANILDSLLNIQKNLNQMADSLEEDIRELEDKLEKLREFSAETSGLFTNSLSDMKLAMQGILVLNNTIVNKDGTYQLPVGTDIHWFKQLKKQSELDRIIGKERPPNVGNREYKLIDLGYGKIWCWVEKGKNVATAEDVRVTLAYNEWLSRMVDKYGLSFIQGERPKGIDELFYEQNATLIKELATGIDSVTGKKLSTAEKLGKASLLANGMITIGVMVKGVLNVGKTQNPKSVKPNKKASGANVPNPDLGVVQSRVNVANGRTRFTPTRPSTGKPVSAGFEHVLDGHFNRPIANSRSIFSITADKLKQVLQSPNVVKSTVMDMSGGQYKRIVDTGEIIGNTALKHGGNPTSWIEVITDRAGNLITTYPVPKP